MEMKQNFQKNLENQVRKFTFLIKNSVQSYNNQDSVGLALKQKYRIKRNMEQN